MCHLSGVLHHIAKHRDELLLRDEVDIFDTLLHNEQTEAQHNLESMGRTVQPKQENPVLEQSCLGSLGK